MFSVIMFSFVV